MITITRLFNAMPHHVQARLTLPDLMEIIRAYNSVEPKPCPGCIGHPGEVERCEGVLSLCPSCHGKGYLDGTEANGIHLGSALQNLALSKIERGESAER